MIYLSHERVSIALDSNNPCATWANTNYIMIWWNQDFPHEQGRVKRKKGKKSNNTHDCRKTRGQRKIKVFNERGWKGYGGMPKGGGWTSVGNIGAVNACHSAAAATPPSLHAKRRSERRSKKPEPKRESGMRVHSRSLSLFVRTCVCGCTHRGFTGTLCSAYPDEILNVSLYQRISSTLLLFF